ncbi:hypothetical protein H4217_000614 [Coemansia sp. RSA 1939]|nr:hypothetical protein H4217_000614 [Coemansia sp. RSA 1939]KAJ2617658.1 hypothetical protein EV177_000424 [Coemansia sp. RSA 1804]KAJ2695422.1 hypothetical protein GGH99_000151 [Coemansia sp. RSA 1285]
MTELSEETLRAFSRDGCAVVDGFISEAEVGELRQRIGELLDEFDPSVHKAVEFETGTGTQYFFDSADKVSYFLESGNNKEVNKIGHGLHIVEPVFRSLTHGSRVRRIAEQLGYRDPRVLQSMVICKQAGVGGAVPMHQDSTFLFTEPMSACGFWLALEDCTQSNGCLEFVPGSHRSAPLERRFVRTCDDTGTEMVAVEPPVRDSYLPRLEPEQQQESRHAECVPVEVKAGALVLIHGQVLHKSARNSSARSRWIYTFHIVDGECKYDGRNWLQMGGESGLTRLKAPPL